MEINAKHTLAGEDFPHKIATNLSSCLCVVSNGKRKISCKINTSLGLVAAAGVLE